MTIPIGTSPNAAYIEKQLLGNVPKERRGLIAGFIEGMFKFYADLNYTYLEINPFVVTGDRIVPLDLAAKLDDTAEFVSGKKWGTSRFPRRSDGCSPKRKLILRT